MENFIQLVKHPEHLSVQGFEALSIGESFNLFFKEVANSIDKKMATLSKSIHPVDIDHVRKYLTKNNILYVKNTSLEILTPEAFTPGMGNMMAHTKALTEGVYVITTLKTEAARLYDWLKQIIKNGRMTTQFSWSIGDFGNAVTKAENFVRNLPDNGRQVRYNLGQVYISFEEFYEATNLFNNYVKTIGGRDIELMAKDLSNVYDLGQLLVKKIHANDIRFSQQAIDDIEAVVNKFIELTNISGALMVLLNELTAVFNAQAEALMKLKY